MNTQTGKFQILFSVVGALSQNTFYFTQLVMGIPTYMTLMVPSIALGLAASWIFREPKKIIVNILAILMLTSIIISTSLLTPVFFGIIADASYSNWFAFISFYRVFGNIMFTAFFMFGSGLLGLFLWD